MALESLKAEARIRKTRRDKEECKEGWKKRKGTRYDGSGER